MLVPIFSLQLNNKVFPRTFAVGKFNGKRPCLVGATAGNKVFIHSPHDTNPQSQQLEGNISFLNVNQVITSLACGQLDEQLKKDLLVVGTSTNIIAYDIDRNVDLFFQEIQDGAHAITIGKWGELPEQLAIVGGNCSIHGFNKKSEDVLWTVTGDNVSSLALLDFNSDGYNELVVGSEDYDIRVFREDQLIAEMQESEIVVSICPLINAKFAYALSNGTVGMYERSNRIWRIKSRNIATVLQTFDVDGDGIDELVTGWSSGKVDIRSDRTSEVIFKDSLNSSIAGVVKSDYRVPGENLLICCTNEGEVRGYKFSVQDTHVAAANAYKNSQEAVRDLLQKRETLLLELQSLENVINNAKETNNKSVTINAATDIPANTEIQTMLTIEKGENNFPGHIAVRVKTSNQTLIRAVIMFAEGLFRGECFVAHPAANQVREYITVPIILPRDVSIDLHLQVFVGMKARYSTELPKIIHSNLFPIFFHHCSYQTLLSCVPTSTLFLTTQKILINIVRLIKYILEQLNKTSYLSISTEKDYLKYIHDDIPELRHILDNHRIYIDKISNRNNDKLFPICIFQEYLLNGINFLYYINKIDGIYSTTRKIVVEKCD
ncbi:unnamed protein product [Rotaria sordida]|uniref:Bardet-Biedl syndrome 2 protein homolog n=1 Tax=Rotaria sordida TaxID=392033 RepID=A0A814ULB4_9BILA|nr:unnamed protein product [Rotaria sordida]